MRSRLWLTVLSAFAILSAAIVSVVVERQGGAESEAGNVLIGGPFALTDDNGKRVTQADYAGRYMLVFFGYTYCPDVCPLTLQNISTALDQVPAPVARQVVPLFITVDPARDTPPVLHDYLTSFRPGIVGLTGAAADVEAAAAAYRVYVHKGTPDAQGDYLVDHTAFIYLMDRNGAYLDHFSPNASAGEIAQKLEQLVPQS